MTGVQTCALPIWQAQGGKEEAKAPDLAAFCIDGLDPDAAMQYYTGDEAGFMDLLELYYVDGKRKTKLLSELVKSDLSLYQIEVHGLKSASANIGAMNVSFMARAQEDAAAQGNRELISEQFPVLLAEYETLLENIGQFLERQRKDEEKEMLPCLPINDLTDEIAAALEELEHFQSRECGERIEAILLHELPSDIREHLLEIQEQLRLYEDDNAEQLLSRLLGILGKE